MSRNRPLPMPPSVLLSVALGALACGSEREERLMTASPKQTVSALLRLHDVEGKLPEQRDKEARRTSADPRQLKLLIADYGERDSFVDDLYIGFVVGALARCQDQLTINHKGDRATVKAGNVTVVLQQDNDRFRILLAESIPQAIKDRAAAEKIKFDRAKSARPPRQIP